MEITWYGGACFRMRGKGAALITDPFAPEEGFRLPRLSADIVTISHDAPSANYARAVRDNPYVVRGPGEYEVSGIFVLGVACHASDAPSVEGTPNTAYLIEIEDVVVCHLGDLNVVPTQEQIEELDGIDVLLLPVGGGDVLTATRAAEVVNLIEPKVVIPMRYRLPDLDRQRATVTRFLTEMETRDAEPQELLRITASQLGEDTQVCVLAPRR
ncbi:MAG: MBL fold metallo-hydrolase [Anaerolineae bacterium]|jgi:L-ascorbate metabolism protein UlaG (beta-lactamase superfamily)|nr:MBL fold metallo-hydrolase [Chloroflexota bacterium]